MNGIREYNLIQYKPRQMDEICNMHALKQDNFKPEEVFAVDYFTQPECLALFEAHGANSPHPGSGSLIRGLKPSPLIARSWTKRNF